MLFQISFKNFAPSSWFLLCIFFGLSIEAIIGGGKGVFGRRRKGLSLISCIQRALGFNGRLGCFEIFNYCGYGDLG